MKLNELPLGTKLELEIYDSLDEKVEHVFASEIEWVQNEDTVHIAAPIREGVVYTVHIGSVMTVFVMQRHNMYKFKAKVIKRGSIESVAILIVRLQGEIEKIQRRQFFRFDCSIPVKYRQPNSMDPKDNETVPFKPTYTRDLSGGGLCIVINDTFETGKILELELPLPGDRTVRFYGKIVRVTKLPYEEKYQYELGILFKKIENRDREVIIKYIFNEQRKLRQKGLI